MSINGDRIRQAREFRGMTQEGLARSVGLDQSAIARIELAEFEPSDQHLAGIALQTGLPLGFFRLPPGPDFPLGSLNARAHATVTRRTRLEAYRCGQIVYEAVVRMAMKVRQIPVTLPRIASGSPGDAAVATRSALSLSPDGPIGNLIHVLEKAGVLVIALPRQFEEIDAFSAWVGDEEKRPVIFFSSGQPGARLRMTIGHDLGHLVSPGAAASSPQAEAAAYAFAAEFLMPSEAMHREMFQPVTLTGLTKLKPRWGVSIQALIRRAKEVGIITERQYRYLYEQLGAQGWRAQEPIVLPAEKPRAVRKIAELVYGNPIAYEKLAADARLPVRLVKEFMEAHAEATEMPRKSEGQGKVITLPRRTPRSGR